VISVEVSTPNSVSVDDVVNRVEVDIVTTGVGGTGGGGSNIPDLHAASHQDGGTDEIALDASQITTGLVPTARLATGTANITKFLRGDQTWQTISTGASDHGALTGLADDDHLQYALAQTGELISSNTTLTGLPRGISLATGVTTLTFPSTLSANNYGRIWTITNLTGGNVTLNAGTSGALFNATDSTFTLREGRSAQIVLVNITGLGNLWGFNVFGPSFAVGGAIGAADVLAGSNITVTPSGDDQQVTVALSSTAELPVYIPVKNTSGVTINKGAPVYATGSVGASGAVQVAAADADDPAKMPAIGLLAQQLADNATGECVVVGMLRGVNTGSYNINDPLYVSTTAGQLTGTKPTGTSELIQNIGRVVRVNNSSGEIVVLGPGRTNDVPNAIDAGKLTTGTVATARLASGTANSSSYLRGDQTWATITAGDVVGPASSVDGRVALFDGTTGKLLKQSSAALAPIATSGSASDLSTGTVPSARLALPLRRLAASSISYTSPTELFGTPPTDIQGNVTTSALAAGTMRLGPCDIAGGPTLASIAFEVSASGLNAGQSVQIGCYARASTGLPTGTPVWTLTQTVGTTTGTYVVSTTNTLPENGCWLALLNPSGNAGTVTIYIYQPTGPYLLALRSLTTRPALISTTGISSLPDVSSYTVSNAASAGVWSVSQQGVLFMLR
jgi:hypothetical protein